MTREKRSEAVLRGASDCLHYEIEMLTTLARELSTGIAGQVVIHNALVESFVIHARVLLYFLYAECPRPDDVIAKDFLPAPDEWAKIRSPKTELLQTVHRRVGKEAAHLTYARLQVTPETKGWEFLQIEKDIGTALSRFLEMVPKSLLGPCYGALKKQWAAANKEHASPAHGAPCKAVVSQPVRVRLWLRR